MKTIALIAQMGGVGKTKIAVNLAVAAGLRTTLLDLDPKRAPPFGYRRKSEEPAQGGIRVHHARRAALAVNSRSAAPNVCYDPRRAQMHDARSGSAPAPVRPQRECQCIRRGKSALHAGSHPCTEYSSAGAA